MDKIIIIFILYFINLSLCDDDYICTTFSGEKYNIHGEEDSEREEEDYIDLFYYSP